MNYPYKLFKKQFINHDCEAWFVFDVHYTLGLIDNPKEGYDAAIAYVRYCDPSINAVKQIFRRITQRDIIYEQMYQSREELIENFRYNGKSIEEMWPDLETLVDFE